MPSVSKAQHKMMEISAHTPGGYGGVPQSVGKEFAAADKVKGSPKSKSEHMARAGAHQSQRATAKDFGVHQSTVSRRIMQRGYKSGGKAF